MKGFMLRGNNAMRTIKNIAISIFNAISVLSCGTLHNNDLRPNWDICYTYSYVKGQSILEQLRLYRYRYRIEFS